MKLDTSTELLVSILHRAGNIDETLEHAETDGLDSAYCLECGAEHDGNVNPDYIGGKCSACGCHAVASLTMIMSGDHSTNSTKPTLPIVQCSCERKKIKQLQRRAEAEKADQ